MGMNIEDSCAALLADWRTRYEPQVARWPSSYGLLQHVAINSQQNLGFAYSLRDDIFAIVPFSAVGADSDPIIIEDKYDHRFRQSALTVFASGAFPNSAAQDVPSQRKAPRGFELLKIIEAAKCMEVGFAYSKGRDAYAILR
jgi:hypothetical protein